ncbi:MAG: TenA family protein [Pseudomonadota bacterium]
MSPDSQTTGFLSPDLSGGPVYPALVEACRPSWRAYVAHAFTDGLADGTLPREAFLRYLRQDYIFLIHFSRAWALAVVKSDRIEEMRLAAGTVNTLIGEEIELHIQTCAAEGIDHATLAATEEAGPTMAYTRYVIDAGVAGDLLDLLVALAPCVLGYAEIGRALHARAAGADGRLPPDHPYAGWIGTYAGGDYQGAASAAGHLLESVAQRLLGAEPATSPRWPDLVRRFDAACRLEADFWQHGLTG